MANTQNLIKNSERTPEERKEQARKAGIASGKSRRVAKMFREAIDDNMTDSDINAITKKMIALAKKGNIKAYEVLRDTRGEKPVEQIQNLNPPVISLERPE